MTQEKFEKARELNDQREAVSEFASVLSCLIFSGMDEVRVAVGRRLIIEGKDGGPVTSFIIPDALPLELLKRIEDCIYSYANELNKKFKEL